MGGYWDVWACRVPAAARSGVVAAAASEGQQNLALKKDGRVVVWGCGYHRHHWRCPLAASAKSGVTAIATAIASIALKGDGSVVAWGCRGNDHGQCRVPRSAKRGVFAIAEGLYFSVAVTTSR